ncbi:hypothetical protein EG328_008805 [Venturia inaequalis]|uniref:Uncharacterized protein n=1 Tax=Venturia inaequalis TaxID=5025 RepID=A0A8H3UDB5_VENIN|nr:hypothetical protein EG328_008805 [Venturia inaequalis]
MCLACEGVVWHRDAQSPAPSYKFTDGIDESPGFRIPNWTGQSLGHRVLPGQSDVAPDDLTPQDPVNDVSGIVIDVTASSSLAALPMEWRGESFRQPNPTTVYPSPAAKGGGTESYERENLSLGELKDIQAARDFVVGNARKNIEEGFVDTLQAPDAKQIEACIKPSWKDHEGLPQPRMDPVHAHTSNANIRIADDTSPLPMTTHRPVRGQQSHLQKTSTVHIILRVERFPLLHGFPSVSHLSNGFDEAIHLEEQTENTR